MPVVGFLGSASPRPPFTGFVAALRQGLNEGGYVEGRNLTIRISLGRESIRSAAGAGGHQVPLARGVPTDANRDPNQFED